MSRIEQLRAAHAAADPGEWDWHQGTNDEGVEFVTVERIPPGRPDELEIMLSAPGDKIDNVDFIALAYNTTPALISLFDAVDSVLDEDGDLRSMDLSEVVSAMNNLKQGG